MTNEEYVNELIEIGNVLQIHPNSPKGKALKKAIELLRLDSFPERENGTDIESIKEQIREEAEFAYADFEQYKIDVLGVDPETVEDELPNDDFRHGMERALEIIYIHMR